MKKEELIVLIKKATAPVDFLKLKEDILEALGDKPKKEPKKPKEDKEE